MQPAWQKTTQVFLSSGQRPTTYFGKRPCRVGVGRAQSFGEIVFSSLPLPATTNMKRQKKVFIGALVAGNLPRLFIIGTSIVMTWKRGAQLWKQQVHEGKPEFPRHPKNTYASETPTTDGQRLFVLFGDLGLYAFDFDGALLWKQPIAAKKTFLNYGAAASPIVHDSQVIMVYDNQADSYIASYDAETGRRTGKPHATKRAPGPRRLSGRTLERTEIITSGKRAIRSYSLAGQLLWRFDGDMSNLVIPSPFACGDLLYVTSGYVGDRHRPVYAFSPGAKDEIESDHESIRWYLPKGGPYNTSPIVFDGRYYTLYDRGFLTCHDAETGEEIYGKQRFPGARRSLRRLGLITARSFASAKTARRLSSRLAMTSRCCIRTTSTSFVSPRPPWHKASY